MSRVTPLKPENLDEMLFQNAFTKHIVASLNKDKHTFMPWKTSLKSSKSLACDATQKLSRDARVVTPKTQIIHDWWCTHNMSSLIYNSSQHVDAPQSLKYSHNKAFGRDFFKNLLKHALKTLGYNLIQCDNLDPILSYCVAGLHGVRL